MNSTFRIKKGRQTEKKEWYKEFHDFSQFALQCLFILGKIKYFFLGTGKISAVDCIISAQINKSVNCANSDSIDWKSIDGYTKRVFNL